MSAQKQKKRPLRTTRMLLPTFAAILALFGGCRQAGLYEELGPLTGPEAGLSLGPSSVTLQPSDSTLFAALNGTPPYSYAVVTGTGTIDAATGIYTAPAILSNETVQVTDTDGSTATASVSVVSSDGALSIAPLYATVPPGQTLQMVVTGGSATVSNYVFDIVTVESGSPAIQTSPDPTPGLYAAGGSEGTDTIRVQDSVTGETRYARVAVAVGSSNVDYDIVNVDSASLSGGGAAGQPFSFLGAFEIRNIGSDNGSGDLFWRFYHSTDTTLGTGDTLLDEGSIVGGLAASASTAIDVAGTWPSSVGPGNLFITVNSRDEGILSNNTEGAIGTTLAAPNVDYLPSAVSLGSGTTAGRAFSGTFTVTNGGADNGTTNIQWYAYISADTALGGDTLFDTGTLPSLASGGSHTGVVFNGNWPSTPDTRYLIVEVVAGDDVSGANDAAASSAVTTTAPDVDYTVPSVAAPTGTVAGGSVSGSFDLQNSGTEAGDNAVFWAVYASTDTTLDSGDHGVASGQTAALAGGALTNVPFTGLWSDIPGSYYLIAEVAAADDVDPSLSSNTNATVGTTTTATAGPDISADSITVDANFVAGDTASGSFTLTNNGTGDITSSLTYVIYASLDGTLDSSDHVIDSGTVYPLADGTSTTETYAGVWPPAAGTYNVIGEVISAGDPTPGNDVHVHGTPISVTAPPSDYGVVSVSVGSAGTDVGSAVSGTFTYENNGPYDGDGTLSFTVWASTDTTLSTTTDHLIDFGSGLSPLVNGATSGATPYSGNWPLTYGTYYVIVSISSANDPASGNNWASSATGTEVGVYYEEPSEFNGNYLNVNDGVAGTGAENNFDPGIVMQPGMRVLIRGQGTAGDVDPNIGPPPSPTNDDIIAFNTGTASVVAITVVLDSGTPEDLGLYIMDGDNSFPWPGLSGTVSEFTYSFVVDTPGVLRWIDFENTAQADIGGYSMYLTAE